MRVMVSGLYWKMMMFGMGIRRGAENWISAPLSSFGLREYPECMVASSPQGVFQPCLDINSSFFFFAFWHFPSQR